MAKIAVIGASGMLGYDLMNAGRPDDTLVGLAHADIEITDPASVAVALERCRPEVVINAVAIIKTELCETEPDRAFLVNAVGAYNVAKAAAGLGAAVVFISTDYVFDGSKPSFTEEDAPYPLNVYGASKLAGEILTKIANPKHFIIRTGWLFGKKVSHKGYNFVTLMLERAKSEAEVRVVNDQTGSPTYTLDLALKIYELIRHQAPFGIYHITNQGGAT
ncbi:MAG: dTDP-4-dehydrorhamnose reductase [Patescibacteria group bacterium]